MTLSFISEGAEDKMSDFNPDEKSRGAEATDPVGSFTLSKRNVRLDVKGTSDVHQNLMIAFFQ